MVKRSKRDAEWQARKAERTAAWFGKRRDEAMALSVGPAAEMVRALIERDALPDEEKYLEPNPQGRGTYYERVNGGPWVRLY